MENLVIANLIVFFVVGAVVVFTGIDLKVWRNWLYGLYGFVTGLFLGLLFVGTQVGFVLGVLFAFAVIYGGATTYWHRKRFKS